MFVSIYISYILEFMEQILNDGPSQSSIRFETFFEDSVIRIFILTRTKTSEKQ